MQDQATHIAIVLRTETNEPFVDRAITGNSHNEAHANAILAAIEATPIHDRDEATEAIYAGIDEGEIEIVVVPM